jgi:hypothetical protein
LDAEYYLTGNGSALVENLIMGGAPSMTSVYHLDGADLRMTHYCAAQNQPRLMASAVDLDHGQITFSFVDITNLRSPTAGHVDGLDVHFLGPDHVTLRYHFTGNGKDSDELIDLTRKSWFDRRLRRSTPRQKICPRLRDEQPLPVNGGLSVTAL